MVDDYGHVISCPFCGSEDECKHMVAAIDYENASIGGGICFDREDELLAVVRQGFESVLAEHGEDVEWDLPRAFDDPWNDFIDRRRAGDSDPLDRGTVARVVSSLMPLADVVTEGGGAVAAFCSRHAQESFGYLVNHIHAACAAAKAKT